ncbi:recombinase family protein [uncultured Ruminococcus sp.]|uniref:recombinase family protein n=1 Tax=uncultured Ruminococcus sp. TaxID=165186 RepID=UPI0025E68FF1|nr:recombinase family protein [uncultured Ruminococcus sp.]
MSFEQNRYMAGLYCRLSRDDDRSGESVSIETQKKILSDYCTAHGYGIYDFYCDDGWSGTNYDRPEFKRMMADMKSGTINMIVVKDLSRLGRNYIETGNLIEKVFPETGIRFIAIGDDVDTDKENMDLDLMLPMKNLFNDFFPLDVSRKTRQAFKTKAEHGEFIGTFAPYGYRRSAADKHVLEPDPETAPIVLEIFEMAAYQGYGYNKMAKELCRRKVLTPSAYRAGLEGKPYEKDPYDWNLLSVRVILENQVYLGHMVNGKRRTVSIKSKRVIRVPEEKWIVVKHTHEPLVSEQLWEDAHARLGARKRTGKTGQVNMFAGLVKCDCCGKALTLANSSGHKNYFACNTYKRKGKEACTFHYLRYDLLYQVVLADLRSKLKTVHRDEDAFVRKVMKKLGTVDDRKQMQMRREMDDVSKRLSKLDAKFDKLYDDRLEGIISDKKFREMAEKCETEQNQLEARSAQLQQQLGEQSEAEQNVSRFLETIREYAEIRELDAELLNRMIDKIVVSDRVPDENGGFSQKIKIYYRFIGDFGEDRFVK